MKQELLAIIKILKIGGMLDEFIAVSLSDGGLSKEKSLEILKKNVDIQALILACFKLGTNALKEKAESDNELNWLDAVAQIVDLSDDLVAKVISDYVNEKLLESEEK